PPPRVPASWNSGHCLACAVTLRLMRDILLKLCRRQDLTRDEAADAFTQIMSGKATEAQIGGLLIGLAAKGTTVDELVGAVTVMREKSVAVSCDNRTEVIL